FADVLDMYKSEKGGIIPTEAAQHHKTLARQLIKQAFADAEKELGKEKIDLIAYSHGPGLSPCLHVGLEMAKEYAKELNVPLIGVNHPAAHLTSGQLLTDTKNPVFLYISGANTQVISIEGQFFIVFGETLDIGLGNALDKFAREIGLGFPGGPKIEQMALKGKYVPLPYTVKGMDASFSGLITKCSNLYQKGKIAQEDLCFSLQETSFAMVTEIAERALAHTQKDELLLIGGVAANKRLCEMLNIMCKERNAKFFAAPLKYAGDNGVMIAWQGILEYQAGRRDKKNDIYPYERADDVKVIWK
ncbi:MAG: KEOPS complex N(6)-L-threonylcarbamoyladenine synthase Kae1, partial [Nanoarchaeota archaeon]